MPETGHADGMHRDGMGGPDLDMVPVASLLDCVCRLLDNEAEFISSAHIDLAGTMLKNPAAMVRLSDLLATNRA